MLPGTGADRMKILEQCKSGVQGPGAVDAKSVHCAPGGEGAIKVIMTVNRASTSLKNFK